MCGGLNESVYHLIFECEELSDRRFEVFGRGDYDFDWLVRVYVENCFMCVRSLARFLRLVMNHRSRFL